MTAFTTFIVSAALLAITLIFQGEINDLKKNEITIKAYEDGSANLKFHGINCYVPAFDSPNDKIRCRKEES